MIYFLHGTDTHKTRRKLHEVLDILKKKRPNAEVFKITAENWSESRLTELLSSQGLFDEKYIVILDGLLDKGESKDCIMGNLGEIQKSIHPFLIMERKIDVRNVEKVKKVSEKFFEFVTPPKDETGIFVITKPLVEKDKKGLWITYTKLLQDDVAPEEIHGVIFWQIKNMILASRSKDTKESGLTPFQYKIALSGGRQYKDEELIQMSNDLVEMTHKVRSGKGDLEIMLEKWILSL
ncbi:MAG: hypothetical protein WCK48_01685 [bacterium]